MAFQNFYLTDKGATLLAKAQIGGALTYTRAVVGDGSLGALQPTKLADVINKITELSISEVDFSTPNVAGVQIQFTNKDIQNPFYWREIGLFAKGADGTEVLYAYGNAGDKADYIPSYGTSPNEFAFSMNTAIGNAANVTAVISSDLVYATKQFVNDAITNTYLNADKNIYVTTTGSDTTGNGSFKSPYATITYALTTIPKNLNGHTVRIRVSAGTYNDSIYIAGFYNGSIIIKGALMATTTHCICDITLVNCTATLNITGFCTTTPGTAVSINNCTDSNLCYLYSDVTAKSNNGINVSNSHCFVEWCQISNKNTVIYASACSTVWSCYWYSSNNNGIGLYANSASTICKTSAQPLATTLEVIVNGGIIR